MALKLRSRLLNAALLLAALLAIGTGAGAGAATTYQQIRVIVGPDVDPAELFFHPDLEPMSFDDEALILLSRPELTAELEARGFTVEVEIPDLEAFYIERNSGTRDYGIWHTYDEMVDEMNAIHAEFPEITTAPEAIGTTYGGLSLWAMKVSDNPTIQEDEPEVLFDGVHHAREIMALEIPLHFIRYLCENYGQDPVITFIVDQRQVWFVPMVNPDGFVYNEQIAPYGGGMWRKNRRDNGIPGCEGVDLNRNYPFQWGGQGSSGDPCDNTYRGPSPASEPEIIAHTDFINSHQFVTWQSYHSVVGLIIFPWGYTTLPTPDHETYMDICEEMTRDSFYDYGAGGASLYLVSGGAFDWGYGATGEHDKIFALTTEIAGSGFWPDPSERDGLIEENLYSDIYFCLIAGAYLALDELVVIGGDGNGRLDPGETASIAPTITNEGLTHTAENVRLTITCNDPYVTLHTGQSNPGDVGPRETITLTGEPFDVSVDAGCPEGRQPIFTVRLEADGGISIEESLPLVIGEMPLIYACDFELETHGWTQDVSHTAAFGEFVRIDPIPTPYQPGEDTTPDPGIHGWITLQNPGGQMGYDVDAGISATRSPVMDMSAYGSVRLDMNYFFGQNETGDDPEDFFRIDVSNDNGASYPVNLVQIGDVNHGPQWLNLQVDLEEFLTLTDQMVIRVQASDGVQSADVIEAGIDDVFVFERGDGNEPPGEPSLVSPADGATGLPLMPELVVANAVDPEGDELTYGFRVYGDPELTQIVASVDGIPEGATTTAWTVPSGLDYEHTYYWRAYAADPQVRGLYMPAASFTTMDATSSVAGRDRSRRALLAAGPNPARGEVRIRYYTPSTPIARLEILDVTGRRVRTLPGVRWAQGWHEVAWDGRGEDGTPLGEGLYWIRLVLPNESRTVRVIRLD